MYRLGISITTPISQALLPSMSKGFPLKKYIYINIIILLLLVLSTLIALVSLELIFYLINQEDLITNLGKYKYIFQFYGLLTVLNYVSRCLGYPLSAGIGGMKNVRKSSYWSLCVYIILTIVLFSTYGLTIFGVLCIFVLTEITTIFLRGKSFYAKFL